MCSVICLFLQAAGATEGEGEEQQQALTLVEALKAELEKIDFHTSIEDELGFSMLRTESTSGEPRLGVAVELLDSEIREKHPSLARGDGLLIRYVAPGSTAAAAGLQVDDIIFAWGDQRLLHPQQLRILIQHAESDEKIVLKVIRESEEKLFELAIPERRAEGQTEDIPQGFRRNTSFSMTTKAFIVQPDGEVRKFNPNDEMENLTPFIQDQELAELLMDISEKDGVLIEPGDQKHLGKLIEELLRNGEVKVEEVAEETLRAGKDKP